jgi:hypothetical protein
MKREVYIPEPWMKMGLMQQLVMRMNGGSKSVAKLMIIITAAPSSALMDNNVTSTSSVGFPQCFNGYRGRL